MTNERQKFIKQNRKALEKAKRNIYNGELENANEITLIRSGMGYTLNTDSMRYYRIGE